MRVNMNSPAIYSHVPVMLQETVEALAPYSGGMYVDCTLGGGGHSLEILSRSAPNGRLIGIDRDASAIEAASARLMPEFSDRFTAMIGNFHDIRAILKGLAVERADGILIDLGISSPQVDNGDRGFSYHSDAELDMRMDQRGGLSAADVLNTYAEDELARLIREYGEERWAARIAEFIVKRRPIHTTGELVDLIDAAIPAKVRGRGPHPARRTFQALRIEVNDELGPLPKALEDCIDMLATGGVLAVITFHSLEDRIVKRKFREFDRPCTCPPDAPVCICGKHPTAELIRRKGIRPSAVEIESNNRARSATLRVVRKL